MDSFCDLDIVWISTSTAFVLLMQVGFCCLETGSVRAKNSINVALKNLLDFCFSACLFWIAGFGLMFGTSYLGLFGADLFFLQGVEGSPSLLTFFLFQLVFCGTAATIVSGAVAERVTLRAYLLFVFLISSLIYPVLGHWAWGGLGGSHTGWLREYGFIDFAGSTVVHSTGAWFALAAVLIVGPRKGRFENGPIRGHNLTLTTIGVLLLWFGWFGFNGGSTFRAGGSIPQILVNTCVAGAVGGVVGCVASWVFCRRPIVSDITNGVLAGLVSITAGCNAVGSIAAAAIAAIGSLLCFAASRSMERLRVDDAVGAIPAHGVAGAWGTIGFVLFATPEALDEVSVWSQFWVQVLGVTACFVWTFGASLTLLWVINRWAFPLRVSPDAEAAGLNLSEHGASTELLDLLSEMDEQRKTGDFSGRATVETHSEVGKIAWEYNRVLDKVNEESAKLLEAGLRLKSARDEAEIANRLKGEFLSSVSHELRTPLNGIIGLTELMLDSKIDEEQRDSLSRIEECSQQLLRHVETILDFSDAEGSEESIEQGPFQPRVLLNELISRNRAAAIEKGLILICSVASRVPNELHGDVYRITLILQHLLENAIKFTERGSVEIHVDRSEGSRIEFAVKDTGIGIAPDLLDVVFLEFAQADGSTSRQYGGLGIGLSLAKRLAEKLGGRISVSSRAGGGTSFCFSAILEKAVLVDV